MAAISTDYASIAVNSAKYGSSSVAGDSGFGQALSAQLQDETTAATSATGSSAEAELALTSYSSGQQVASGASAASDSTATTATTEGEGTDSTGVTTTATGDDVAAAEGTDETGEASPEETAEAGEPADGWPYQAMAEWTPGNMQFYDELSGQWIDDNIPHRFSESGDLEYYWEGEWFLDTAVRHRVTIDGQTYEMGEEGEVTETAEGGEGSEGEASLAWSLEGEGPFTGDEYYNTALGQWKLFNFPYRENEDGSREYYWADQWWQDSFEHRDAA